MFSFGAALVLATMFSTILLTEIVEAAPATPSHIATPGTVLQGQQVTLAIILPEIGGVPARGIEMYIHDPGGQPVSLATPINPMGACSLQPPLKPTETRWRLHFVSDGAIVAYRLDLAQAITIPFGGAGDFTISTVGTPEIGTYDPRMGTFSSRPITSLVRWVPVPGSATSSADNTIRPGTYTFNTCGDEGPTDPLLSSYYQNYVGFAAWTVERIGGESSSVDVTSLTIAAVSTNAYWLLPTLAAIGAAVGIFGLRGKRR